jgi:predicted ATPase
MLVNGPAPIEPSALGFSGRAMIRSLIRRTFLCCLASYSAQNATVFFDRSPVCTLALSRYLGFTTSCLLAREVGRVVAEGSYETTVFFIRNQGFIQATAARRISFEDSLVFERLHEQTYHDLGFQIVDVPAGPLADRVALIRQTVGQLRRAD